MLRPCSKYSIAVVIESQTKQRTLTPMGTNAENHTNILKLFCYTEKTVIEKHY